MPRLWWLVVPPAPLRALRAHRLLRLIAVAACDSTRGGSPASGCPELRAWRGLVLGLRDRAVPGGSPPRSAASSPARPAGAGAGGPGAPRMGAPAALTRRTTRLRRIRYLPARAGPGQRGREGRGPMRILGVAGSLRRASYNRGLIRASLLEPLAALRAWTLRIDIRRAAA
jgi:hypothetical protein